jgi:DNA-binding NarL/FixJ family response regulator
MPVQVSPFRRLAAGHLLGDDYAERRGAGGRMFIRMLIVDARDETRAELVRVLDANPAITVVGQAAKGAEATARAERLRPDVVLINVHEGAAGAAPLIAALRETLPRARTLALMSADASPSLVSAVALAGVSHLVRKAGHGGLVEAVLAEYGAGSSPSGRGPEKVLRASTAPTAAGAGDAAAKRARNGEDVVGSREDQVLRMVALGFTDAEISKQMFISPRSVQNILGRIREQTGLQRRTELVRWATEHDIV